jgi:large subunit ribosomal protein L19e
MTNLAAKKKMAAEVLGVGVSRIWLDPGQTDKLQDAITRESIKQLIKDGVIKVKKKKGISRGRVRQRKAKLKKRGRGAGSKEGAKGARAGKKERWVKKVRALRRYVKILKDRGEITNDTAKKLRLMIKGGQVRSLRHLREIISEVKKQW